MNSCRVFAFTCIVLCVTVAPVRAQVLGLNAGAAIPTGDVADIVAAGFALNAYYAYMLNESWAVSGSVGYHRFGSEDITVNGFDLEIEGSVVPVRVGLIKYWGESKRFFTGPQIGAFIPADDFEDLDTKFGLGPKVGFRFPWAEGRSVEVAFEYNNIFIGDENPLGGERVFFDEENVNYFLLTAGIQIGN